MSAKRVFRTWVARGPRHQEEIDRTRITEDGIPSVRERVMRLLRTGARLEVYRLAGNLIQGPEETAAEFERRCEVALENTVSPVYAPEPAEVSLIFERAARARERLERRLRAQREEEDVGESKSTDSRAESDASSESDSSSSDGAA